METLQRTANRGSISTGFDIDNSLKFEPDNSESILTDNQASGNQKTWTWSGWLKRTELGSLQTIFGAGGTYVRFDSTDVLQLQLSGTSVTTNAKFRDTSAWYHLVWILDTTQATAADRARIYINGSRITSFSSATYPSQNADLDVGGTGSSLNWLQLGRWYAGGRNYAGYMAEVHYLNGTVAEPTEFGEYDSDSGIWIPKEYTGGGYGAQGYYYKFDNASNLGEDSSGEGHDASSLINITSADQATDTPTNNFAIPNVIGTTRTNVFTYTEGGTKVIHQGGSDWNSWANTIAVGSGKWYAEFKIIGGNSHFVGVGSEDYYFVGAGSGTGWPEIYYGYSGTNSVGYHNTNGDIYNNGTQVVIGTTYTTNDIISVALDMDNGKVYFAKNGTYINSQNPVTGTNAQNLPDTSARYFIGTSHYTSSIGAECNFGGYTSFSIASGNSDSSGYGTFEYAPPSGYYALCTKNLAEYG